MTRVLVGLVAVLALWPASARASAWSYDRATGVGSFVDQRDAMSNPNVSELVGFAHGWLADHGLSECATGPTGHVRMAPDLDGVGGGALGCDVWVELRTIVLANAGGGFWLNQLGFTIGHELMHASRDADHPNGWTHEQMGELPAYDEHGLPLYDEDGLPLLRVGPGVEADYQLACRWYVRAMVADARAARRARTRAEHRARTRRER